MRRFVSEMCVVHWTPRLKRKRRTIPCCCCCCRCAIDFHDDEAVFTSHYMHTLLSFTSFMNLCSTTGDRRLRVARRGFVIFGTAFCTSCRSLSFAYLTCVCMHACICMRMFLGSYTRAAECVYALLLCALAYTHGQRVHIKGIHLCGDVCVCVCLHVCMENTGLSGSGDDDAVRILLLLCRYYCYAPHRRCLLGLWLWHSPSRSSKRHT